MQRTTLVLLLLLVAALTIGVWWSSQQVVEFGEALFPGLDVSEVVSVRVDNVKRDVQVRIDRDEAGNWNLVDPLEAPADEVMVQTLLEAVDEDQLRLVPGKPDPAVFGFEPPEIVLHLDTRSEQRYTAEIGVVDAAANSVHLRVRGRIYRAPRRLHTELSRDVSGYRRPYVFRLRPEEVGEIARRGTPLVDQHRFGYEFRALRDNLGWRLVEPFAAGLHPGPLQLLLVNTVRIPVDSFFAPSLDPSVLGLDPPRRAIQVVDLGGNASELQIGEGRGASSFSCRVQPDGDAFLTPSDSVQRLEIPIELLLDRRLLRAPREFLDRIELTRAAKPPLILERVGEEWTVRENESDDARGADPRLFDQFLAKLESILFYDMLEVGDLGEDEIRSRVRFVGAGEEWEVRLGETYVEEGVECLRVQQAGDGIVGLLELADAEFLETRVSDLRDHRLSNLDELNVRGLILEQGKRSKRWNRDDKGRWTREGRETEAFEILPLVDPLLHLRAQSFASGSVELSEPIAAEVLFANGERARLELGRAQIGGESRSVFVREGELATLALDQQDLLERILTVLDGE